MGTRVCYLLRTFGYTGGSMVLYRFMDMLVERGYEVVAATPEERLQWHSTRSAEVISRFMERSSPARGGQAKRMAAIVGRISAIKRAASSLPWHRHPIPASPIEEVQQVTEGLLRHWTPSDFTIATFCTTAFAAYALSDQTIPLYHMQHYEEVFFEAELWRKIARATYFLPIDLVANSSWLQQHTRQFVGRETQLLLPGIDRGVFYPRQSIAQKYAHPGRIIILSYYSPVRFKAWGDAVNAMKIVYSRLGTAAVEWKVFGPLPEGPTDVPIARVGLQFGQALADLYAGAHVVMMPSWYESFPLPPLEAMASGTAVITTRSGTEDYAEDGQNALVVPARDPEALANAIIMLVQNRRLAARLAENGVDTARHFSWERAVANLEHILHMSKNSLQRARHDAISSFLAGTNQPS